jgi:hypothetical protein
MINVQGDQAPAKQQKMLKKFENSLTENLNMCRVSMKFVSRLLATDQKQRHINVRHELLEKANEDPTFILRITTSDESLIYGYPERKRQSSQWKTAQSPKAKCV